ncbi:MAG TPA: TonB-dependent siderophore receptor [Pyrinomonadaceae bacterium]|nr:TonB-dependent siderophore receptor [Pyrinomonadaceae bacterium]
MIVKISNVLKLRRKIEQLVWFMALFLVVLLLASICFGQDSKPDSLRGVVVDQNHAAVVGARVNLKGATDDTAVTDSNGEFSLPVVSGDYQLRIMAAGFETVTRSLTVAAHDFSRVEIILPIAQTTAMVTITGTDALGYRAEAVSGATRTLTNLRDVPQSIAVISKQQIVDQSMKSIAEVVNYVPGVSSHQGENNRDQLVIRGVSTSADFFLDGMRDDVQYYRDLYNLDRVEVLKGPNAMTFGRGGGGGVLNRVAKEAGFSRIRDFNLDAGSFNDARLAADLDQPLGQKLAARLNGMYERAGSFRRYVNLHRYGLNPTLSFTPNGNTRVTFGYESFHDRRVADRGIPSFAGRPAQVAIDSYFGNPRDSHVRAAVNRWTGTIQHQSGRLLITSRTMFGDYDRGYQNYVPGAVNASQTLVAISAYNNATSRQNLFNQTDLNYSLATGKVKHNLLAGTEFGRQVTDNFRNTGFFNNVSTSIQVPYANPLVTTPVVFRQSATDANNHVRANLGAAFLQDQVELSRRIQVLAGVRFDYFDLQFHNNRTGEDLRRIDRLASPRFGVVVKPLMPLSIYGSYSVSYLPSSGDQFASLTSITQQVKPEQFTNYEFGAKWDARRNLTFTAATYRQDRTNTRAADPNDPARILQTGSQRTNGFEAGVSGNLTRLWSVSGGYAYQDAFISSATAAARAGAQVALVPRRTFSIWNKYQLVNKLALGVGVIQRADMFAAIDNTVTLPGYLRIDAAVYFPFSERWKLQANIENLLNRTYYLNADGNNNISPGTPRAVRIGLATRF